MLKTHWPRLVQAQHLSRAYKKKKLIELECLKTQLTDYPKNAMDIYTHDSHFPFFIKLHSISNFLVFPNVCNKIWAPNVYEVGGLELHIH